MKFKTILSAITYCLLSSFCVAQTNSTKTSTKIGRNIRPFLGREERQFQIINYKTTTIKISDFKDKLLIIDFWASWCGPCREFLQTADSLQKKFGDKIMILPVTDEDSTATITYLNSVKKTTGINAVSVFNDHSLGSIFGHIYIPHEVWISPGDQKVIAITDAQEVTAENIEKVLKSKPVNWQMKVDYPQYNVKYNSPLFTTDSAQLSIPDSILLVNVNTPGYRFKLTKYFWGLGSVKTNRDHWFGAYNCTIQQCLAWAAINPNDDAGSVNANRVILKVKDTTLFKEPIKDMHHINYAQLSDWYHKNDYCFELSLIDTTLNLREIAQKELNNYFKKLNIEGSSVVKTVPCYVLKRTSNIDKVTTVGGDKKSILNQYQLSYHNYPFAWWIFKLQTYFLQTTLPVYDESGFANSYVDMDLNCNMEDVNSINRALAKYDLQFVKENKTIKEFVVSQGY